MRLEVIIVNYRTSGEAEACLRSLAREAPQSGQFHVTVVDNASGDDSATRLNRRRHCEGWTWMRLMCLKQNLAFGGGNNTAIHQSLAAADPPDAFLLLNPDTVVRPGAVETLVAFLDRHTQAGIVGAQLEDANGRLQPSARLRPTPWSELLAGTRLGILSRILNRHRVNLPLGTKPTRCDWVSGAAMLIRRQTLEDVGGFDEGFFLYFEELDLCLRALNAGWEVWHHPEARVVHAEGAATGIGSRGRKPVYWFDSRRRYLVKHHGLSGLVLADLLWGIGHATYWIRRRLGLVRSKQEDIPRLAYDLLTRDLRAVLRGDVGEIIDQNRHG